MDEQILEAAKQVIQVTGPYFSAAEYGALDSDIIDSVDTDTKFLGYLADGTVDSQVDDMPYVHLLILTYQFRSMPDPLATLYKIREKAASVLVVDWVDEKWPVEAITKTLTAADLQPEADQIVETPDGKFHVWLCRNLAYNQPDDEV